MWPGACGRGRPARCIGPPCYASRCSLSSLPDGYRVSARGVPPRGRERGSAGLSRSNVLGGRGRFVSKRAPGMHHCRPLCRASASPRRHTRAGASFGHPSAAIQDASRVGAAGAGGASGPSREPVGASLPPQGCPAPSPVRRPWGAMEKGHAGRPTERRSAPGDEPASVCNNGFFRSSGHSGHGAAAGQDTTPDVLMSAVEHAVKASQSVVRGAPPVPRSTYFIAACRSRRGAQGRPPRPREGSDPPFAVRECRCSISVSPSHCRRYPQPRPGPGGPRLPPSSPARSPTSARASPRACPASGRPIPPTAPPRQARDRAAARAGGGSACRTSESPARRRPGPRPRACVIAATHSSSPTAPLRPHARAGSSREACATSSPLAAAGQVDGGGARLAALLRQDDRDASLLRRDALQSP